MAAFLLEKKFVKTSFGNIAYMESGSSSKPPVLFVHGIPTSGYLWRNVIQIMQNDFHCFAPDLMGLGDTDVDSSRDIFHMEAQAKMLVEFMEVLGHKTFAMVCHDQGGAASQFLAAKWPERVSSFILTNCVCYDNWPVFIVALCQKIFRIPFLPSFFGSLGLLNFLTTSGIFNSFYQGVYNKKNLTKAAIREYLKPMVSGSRERKRFIKFFLAGDSKYSMEAVEGLKKFNKPTIVIWAADDHWLSPSWGQKLLDDIPGAKSIELVPFCGHFWQEEKPEIFAKKMINFLRKNMPASKK